MLKRTIFISNPARLSIRNAQLRVELPENGEERSVDIQDVGVLVLDNPRITLSHAVLQACMKAGAAVFNCDERHMPQGLMLPQEGHVEMSERHRQQLDSSLPLRKNLWSQTVQAKILNQAGVLAERHACPPRLKRLASEVGSGDPNNCEGQAAAIYWPRLFQDRPGFLRDREGEEPNAHLNYGYAVLRAMTARALVASGLILALGIHHRNKYNAFCLADDMMEPYRPFVDALVLRLADEGPLGEELTLAHRARLWEIASLDTRIDGQVSPLWNAVIRSAQSLQACFAGSARKLVFPQYGSP